MPSLRVAAGHVERSQAAARYSAAALRNSPEMRLGKALLDWLRRPWRWRILRQAWTILRDTRPQDQRRHVFWPLQFAPPDDPAYLATADENDRAGAEALWREWERLGNGRAFRLGTLMLTAWQTPDRLRLLFWRNRLSTERPARQPGVVEVVPEGEPARWTSMAPGWMQPLLSAEGIAPHLSGGCRRLLVCVDDTTDADSVLRVVAQFRAETSGNGRIMCWLLTPSVPPGIAEKADVVGVSENIPGRVWLPPAVQPSLHHPLGYWGRAAPAGGLPAPSTWSELFEAARGAGPGSSEEKVERILHLLANETVSRRLDRLAAEAGVQSPSRQWGVGALASVICSTCRPHRVPALVAQFRGQSYAPRELILVLHGFEAGDVGALEFPGKVLLAPSRWSLGDCLQYGVEESAGKWIFKWDDDDLYEARYLEEHVALLSTGAGSVLSKAAFPIAWEGEPQQYLARPHGEFRPGTWGAGATISASREVFSEIAWRPRRLNEDNGFFVDCLARSIPMATSSRFYYVCQRGPVARHTWRDPPAAIIEGMEAVPYFR